MPLPAEARRLRGRVGPALAAAGLLLVAGPALAAKRPAAEQARIDRLIEDVGQSKAVFIRNGVEYDAAKAVSHLKFKLFMAGSRVQSAKDFIDGVASHSEESGQPYEIRLPGAKARVPLRAWLFERLALHEKSSPASSRPAPTPPAAATAAPR